MNPSSALLQDLLRERKASQHAQHTNRQQSEYAAYERQIQSSPIRASGARQVSDSSNRRTSGYTAPMEMGLREMEEYISKINKQNFDLKLEIFHRRQRSEALEAKAEKAEELQVQNDELRQINDDLLLELEKRDVAVEEAVALICDLEAKVDELENQQSNHARSVGSPTAAVKDSEARALEPHTTPPPSHATHKIPGEVYKATQARVSSPSPNRGRQDQAKRSLLQSPSFLRDNNPSTSALRGLFLKDRGSPTNAVAMAQPSIRSLRRAGSFLSQDEYPETVDGDTFSLNPRRLSLLSESSFVSVYGKDKEKITPSNAHHSATTASPIREVDTSFARSLSPQEGRIRSWIENRDYPASPSKRTVANVGPDKFSSIGELLEPSLPIAKNLHPPVSPTPSKKHRQQAPPHRQGKPNIKPSFAGPIFGSDVLPPTPGTMSTATLDGRSSNHSIVAETSFGGTSQQISGSTIVPDDQSYSGSFTARSLRSEAAHGVSQAFPDDDTDIEVSDDEQHLMAVVPSTKDAYNYPSRPSDTANAKRPAFASHVNNFMFNGADVNTMRPTRTISHPSPGKSNPSASQESSRSSGKTSTSSKNGPQVGERTSSAQKGTPYFHNAIRPPTVEPNQQRPLPLRSKSSQLIAQAPSQNFASRLFRRNPSQPTQPPPRLPPAQAETVPPESKLRPPRPSSLYLRSTSHQPQSTAPPKATRVSRPGTAGGPPANTRRHSVTFNGSADDTAIANREGLDQQKQGQQQNKRLSVGAIGRSASLKIKEGFGRKKY